MANRSEHKFVLKGDDKLAKTFQSAKGHIRGLDKAFSKLNVSAAGLVGVLGVGGFGAVLQRNLDQIDKLAKNADKIGVTTEALTELNFAVSQTSSLTDEQFNMAMQRMARKLGDAEAGLVDMSKTLNLLELSLDDLAKMRPDEQFLAIADAVKELEDDQKQLAVSAKIFDSEAAAIVTTLQLGSDAIAEYREEARKMGITLTREQAAKAEAANDAIDKLDRTWKGLTQSMAIALAGPFSNFVKWVGEAIIKTDTLVRKVFDLGVNLNRVSTTELNAEILKTEEQLARLDEQLQGKRVRLPVRERIKKEIGELNERLDTYRKRLEQLTGATQEFNETTSTLRLGQNTAVIDPEELKDPEDRKKDKTKERLSAMERFIERSRDLAGQFDDMWANSLNRFTDGVGTAFADAIIYGENLSDGLRGALRGFTHQIISTLASIAAKKATIMALEKAGIISTGALSQGTAVATAAAWAPAAAFVSLATLGTNAIPASAALASTTALSSTLANSQLLGIAHDGLPQVPRTGTYLLEGGERVVKKEDNKKLTKALDSGGLSGQAVEFNITIQALDTRSATEVILQNEPTITNMVQRAFNSRGRPGPKG